MVMYLYSTSLTFVFNTTCCIHPFTHTHSRISSKLKVQCFARGHVNLIGIWIHILNLVINEPAVLFPKQQLPGNTVDLATISNSTL